ncbi:MAG: efflux RND transporter periplasmic adaptor subunit, partial [Candidatus Aminicenantes bacterium]|nr:efflux RND transporter periplasmic adaptor subunit [Candidatus Aminicenantes bacterium]
MNKKKVIIIVGIILVLVVAGFLIKPLFKSENGAGFEFTKVKKGNLENIVTSTGTLSAVKTVEVGSQVSGIIESIYVDFNDSVKQGQVLAILDKTLFEISVRDTEARVYQARASLAQAIAEVKRNQPLFEKGHVSEMEFLVFKTTAQTAEASFKMAQASLNKAKTNLGYTIIRSPIDGTVIERTVDAGQTIAASFQAPKLFVIAEDLTRMQIEANVDESDIGQIKENQPAHFTVQAYPDKTFNGTVRQIRLQPQTIQNVVNYTVIIDAPNQDRLLLPGMTATVDFIIEQVKNVLLVSNKALNFSPPMEIMREIFQKQMKNRQGQRRQSRGPGNPFQMPDDTGRVFYMGADNSLSIVFYLDTENLLSIALFKKGATDGMFTEIKKTLRG